MTVSADGKVTVNVKADGTTVGPDKPKTDDPEGEHADVVTGKQILVPYTVYVEPTRGASLKQVTDTDSAAGVYVLEVVSDNADFESTAGKVTFTYTNLEGEKCNGTATFDSDSNRYTVDLSSLSVQTGSLPRTRSKPCPRFRLSRFLSWKSRRTEGLHILRSR